MLLTIFSAGLIGAVRASGNTSHRHHALPLGTPAPPTPYIDIISPVSVHPGATSVTLTVYGTNFQSDSVVEWNQTGLTTTFVNEKQLTAAVPDSLVAAIGVGSITVVTPSPLDGTSNIFYLPVAYLEAGTVFPSTPSSTTSTGITPQGLVVADFNGDGKLDIAVANNNNNGAGSISILLGNGNGTFTLKSTPAAGLGANWIVVGDFNDDGIPDLAVANLGSTGTAGISILLGDGAGNFTLADSLPTGSGPFSIVTGDFNGDGELDLAVSNSNDGTVTILLGDGVGSYVAGGGPYTVGSDPQVIVAGDFNEDGILDLAVANENDSTVSVLLGNGNGHFTVQSPALATNGSGLPIGLIAADFNNDGHLDLAAVDASDVAVFLGHGNGTFASAVNTSSVGTFLIAGVTGDFNGDGNLDLVVTDQTLGEAFLLPGVGNGTFGTPVTFTTAAGAFGTTTADFNGDGALDLAITNGGADNVTVFLQILPVGIAPASLSFGNQNVGSPSTAQTVTLTNGTSSTLTISSVDFTGSDPGDFSETDNCTPSVASHASCTIHVTFTPSTTGSRSAVLTVTDNNSTSPQSVAVSGTGIASSVTVTLSPTSLTFPSRAVGTTSPSMSTTLTNTSGSTLDITSIAITGANSGDFGNTTTCGATLAGSANCTISVTFSPTAIGSRSAAVTITDNATGSPQSVPLSGTATQGTPVITWATPAAITYGTALSGTQLDATANVAGTFVYSPVSGTVLGAGSQTLSVTFTPTDTTDYTNAPAMVTLTVNKATPTITWATPSAITYGTALGGTQLDATASVAGSFAYAPATGTVLPAGPQNLSVTFTPTDTTDYNNATGNVTLTVNKATPTITWATPTAITYGTALSATQLDATASVGGSFVYTPASGAVLAAGAQPLSVAFTPTDTTDYNNATGNVTLTVNKATPTITWATPAAITYGTALSGTQLDATASTAGAFVYTPTSGTVLTAGAQPLSVAFTPTDTTDFNNATGNVMLTVNKATPTITWATPAAITYGTALSGTQLDATASTAGAFVYTPASGTVLTAGAQSLSVTFTPTDTTDYNNATGNVTLTVNKATPTITWATPSAITYGTALSATELDATASVPGTFVYTPASGTVLAGGAQSLSVTFTPTDATDYNTATGMVTLTVNKATPVITWATPASITYGTALSAVQLDATTPVAGTFVYSPASGTVLTAGAQTLSVAFTPANTTDYNTATAMVTLTVTKAAPVITWATPVAITYPTALSATQLNATASVPGTFVFAPPSGTVLNAGAQTLVATFTPTDTTDYTVVTAMVTLTINKATPVITWATPAAITYGTALSATQLDATASTVGSLVYTPAAGAIVGAGTQTLSVTFTPTDTTDYATVTATVSLTVNKATPAITWASPSAITYGTALGSSQLDASSSAAGIYVYTPASGTVLNSGVQTLSVAFTPTDATDDNSATGSVMITVNPAATTTTLASSLLGAAPGETVTFTSKVTSSAGMPPGSVSFFDGATLLGMGALSSGTATFAGSFATLGSHSVSATYTGSTNFTASTSPAVTEAIANPDFTMTPTSTVTSATVKAGQTTTIPLSFTTVGDFTGAVMFTVTGLPANSTGSFVPVTIMLAGNVGTNSMVIQTSGRFGYLSQSRPPASRMLYAGMMLFPFAGLAFVGFAPVKKLNTRRRALLLVLALLCGVSGGGCAGYTNGSSNIGDIGTPAGTYTLTITGTSGAITHSIPFTLVVE